MNGLHHQVAKILGLEIKFLAKTQFLHVIRLLRAGEYSPEKVVSKIEDERIRTMVENMISLDPSSRLSVSEYLAAQRGEGFPEYFFSFLQSYMR